MADKSRSGLTIEDAGALIGVIAAHVALIAALTLSPLGRAVQPPPQRMIVSIADTVADRSVSPDPAAQPAPDVAPTRGEQPHADKPAPIAPPVPQPVPVAKPEPAPVIPPVPKPAPVPKPEHKLAPVHKPAPVITPVPKPKPVPDEQPAPKLAPKPKLKPKPKSTPVVEPEPTPAAKPVVKPAPKATTARTAAHTPAKIPAKPSAKSPGGSPQARVHPATPVGGSKIGNDFLAGIPGVTSPGTDKVSPGDAVAAVSSASLVSAISRQIKPHWSAPAGVDTEKLVTVLAWTLNPDGSLAGPIVVISQTGVNDANRAQAQVYSELAIRAVRLAAPFHLPPAAYAQWHRVSAFRFDRKLSQ